MANLNEQTDIDFLNQPLVDVVEYFRQRHDQEILIDPRLDRPSSNLAVAPVTHKVRDISLLEVSKKRWLLWAW